MEDISLHILDIVENSIAAGAKNIYIRLGRKGKILKILIEDDGVGMDEQAARKCVDPFYTTKKGKKTGLGLSLLMHSCKESGGSLKIESKRGKGTKLSASFDLSNIDCKPLGDIAETLKVLKAGNPGVNINYGNRI